MLVLPDHPTQMHTATVTGIQIGVRCQMCGMIFPQTAQQTDASGCLLEANVTTLSTEKKTKSKATHLRGPKLSAEDLVSEPVNFQFLFIHLFLFISDCILYSVCDFCICAAFFLELLTIQSAEENDFVIKYSPEVWKGFVNVWLGMYYDTNSKYHVTGGLSLGNAWLTSLQ